MNMVTPRRLFSVLLGMVVIVLSLFLFVNECATGGAMAGAYQDCECRGYEHQLFDQTAADGPRKTICVGLVTATTCYEFRDGPTRTCAED